MHKKSFTFGLGTGILALTLLFYFVYNVQLAKYKTSFANELEAQKAQIENEFSTPEPEIKEVLIQPTNDEIIEKAKQMGMTFAEKTDAPDEHPDAEPPQEPDPTPKPQSTVLTDTDSYAIVEIINGNVSSEIANILFKAGVVDDAASFDAFLSQTGNTKKLAFGKFTIPKNLSYEEVLEIIKVK